MLLKYSWLVLMIWSSYNSLIFVSHIVNYLFFLLLLLWQKKFCPSFCCNNFFFQVMKLSFVVQILHHSYEYLGTREVLTLWARGRIHLGLFVVHLGCVEEPISPLAYYLRIHNNLKLCNHTNFIWHVTFKYV